jgi:hypothetical protein
MEEVNSVDREDIFDVFAPSNCHHEEGFSPTRDLLFVGGGREL